MNNYPAGVSDSHPYFTDAPSDPPPMEETWITCPDCKDGEVQKVRHGAVPWDETDVIVTCGTCRGMRQIAIQVCSYCELSERDCRCGG